MTTWYSYRFETGKAKPLPVSRVRRPPWSGFLAGFQNTMTVPPFSWTVSGPGEGICHLINQEEGRHLFLDATYTSRVQWTIPRHKKGPTRNPVGPVFVFGTLTSSSYKLK